MTCQTAAEQMSVALDDPTAGRFWVGVHLMFCRDCRRFRRQLAVLAEAGLPAPAEDVTGDVGLSASAHIRIAAALVAADDKQA